ncbi:MAG: monovalent cation/H+ antiporter subunit D family protein [Calditrichaeota bacterium]|nr:monovalent cation/H+ antiporter subunit D family protein [Calditrichota bacterium]RQV98804.1 MAG: monovalent cation/H+ antiporter subunit D family protein [Calditrichota bacterium]
MENWLPIFVAAPLGMAFLNLLVTKVFRHVSSYLTMAVVIFLLWLSIRFFGEQPFYYAMGGWMPPLGITLVWDSLSQLLVLIVSIITLAVTLFALPYMQQYTAQSKFYSLYLLMIAGMYGVILTGDFFNLFVFLEIASLASYALVAFGVEAEELEASFKYLVLGGVSSTIILLGIALLYSATGTLNMADMAGILAQGGPKNLIFFIFALFIMGFGLKSAMVPFHAWLPDAHPSAPAPISAMLSGLIIKALGIYCVARIFFIILGIVPIVKTVLMVLGGLSMVIGVFLAVGQWDFKRLLAYHSISQMGYVMVGIGLATPLGILGGLFHLLNHAVFKSLLFLCSGAFEYSTGTRQLKQLGGLMKKMPWTGTSCSIAALSISGIPPFNGFWSKLIIIIALLQAEYYLLGAVTVFVSFMTLISFVKVQKYSLFGSLPKKFQDIKEVPVLMVTGMVILALLCVGLGLLYPFYGQAILESARNLMVEPYQYLQYAMP